MKTSGNLFKKSMETETGKISDPSKVMGNISSMMSGMKEGEIEEKWTEKYKRSIDCSHPKGFSQRAHCQGKKKKSEHKEAASSGGGVGAFEGPIAFKDSEFVRKSFAETPKLKKVEATEATSSSSIGGYDTPAAWAKSTKKGDWRGKSKTQIPGGSFVSVKEKCKKFPYCNQGDIKALNMYKNKSLKEAITNVANKLNISENVIKSILLHEIEKMNK